MGARKVDEHDDTAPREGNVTPDALSAQPASPHCTPNGNSTSLSRTTKQQQPDISLDDERHWQSLPSITHPSQSYIRALEQLRAFRKRTQEELARIDAAVAATPKSSSASARSSSRSSISSSSNPSVQLEPNTYETASKRVLWAEMELARMDYMDDAPIAALLYRASHGGEDPKDTSATSNGTQHQPSMAEVDHVLLLYSVLRRHLSLRVRRRSKLVTITNLLLVFTYLLASIPLFFLALLTSPLEERAPKLLHALGFRNHFHPVDLIQKYFARGFLGLCGIRVGWRGLDSLAMDESTLAMFSHASNLDPVIAASGPLAFKWIGKKSLFRIPVIGWILSALKHIPIERENREKAIQSLKVAAQVIKKYRRCLAVSPEGTRSKSGRLQDFKKGAFHTGIEVAVPITPMLIEGAYELWPPGSVFAASGDVTVTFMKRMDIGTNEDYNALANRTRRNFLHEILALARKKEQAQISNTKKPKSQREGDDVVFTDFKWHALWIPISYTILAIIHLAIRSLF